MRLSFPDELFYLKNKGDAELSFDAGMFPRNQLNFKRTALTLKISGKPTTIANLTLRLTSTNHASEIVVKTDANGLVSDAAGQPLNALRNEALLDQWTIRITPADNPNLDLNGIGDVMTFFEYTFDYR
jgi:hypothetical protein